MKGRPNIFRDQEIILKAQDIFWKKGYNATTLSDISKATGAGAGTLYHTFKGGKKELFKRSLLQRKADLNNFKTAIENSEDPIELIKEFFINVATESKDDHFRGCIVANTIVEMTFVDEELENEAIDILKETERLYTNTILEEQKKGTLKSEIEASVLGRYLITVWCGINSLRRVYPNKEILRIQIELQLKLIN
ncbi:TetR/AcrR family transcriptional regulator [Flavobacterium sp. GP15]|nr:TetR/AcrR family transcriptional regulator [Flavobacterium sp. GP15]